MTSAPPRFPPPRPGRSSDRHLVIGATGVAGAGIVRDLAANTDEPVFALSRSGRVDADLVERVQGVRADLFQIASLYEALEVTSPTLVYYAAHRHPSGAGGGDIHPRWMQLALNTLRPFSRLIDKLPGAESYFYGRINHAAGLIDGGENEEMFRNLVSAIDSRAFDGDESLRHLALVTGGRLSGVHLGPDLWPQYPNVIRADSPRHPGPSWYFEVEDTLWKREPDRAPWTWSIHRPHFILGAAEGMPYSIVNALGAYAILLREQGLPLIFPGGRRAFDARWEAADAALIGAQMRWASRDPGRTGRAWMVGNGPAWRWAELWPKLAARYGMKPEVPSQAAALPELVPHPQATWARSREKAGLPELALDRAMPIAFLHQSMVVTWDVTYDLETAREAGFTEQRDHWAVVDALLGRLETRGVLPPA